MYALKQPLQPAFYLNLRPKILTNYQEEALEKILMNQEKFFNGSYFEHISLLVLIIIYLPLPFLKLPPSLMFTSIQIWVQWPSSRALENKFRGF